MEEGLDEILSGTPEETPAIEQPEVTEEAPATAERPRGPDGKFIPKDTGETPQEAPAAEAAPPAADHHVPRAALEDERRKRQELERRLAEIEANVRQPQSAQPQAQPIDFWEDPNSFIEDRFNQLGQSLIQQWEHRQQVNRVNQSEAAAKAKYPDFEEVAQEFVKQVQINPSLVQAMAAADNPGEFVYQRGKQALELASVGDLEAYKAKVIADYKAEILANAPSTITAPTSTVAQRSVGSRSGPEWSGPAPLSEILNG